MFASKSLVVIALLALCNIVAAAVPPGCLLAAINTHDHPADLKAICGSDSKKMQREIRDACDDSNTKAALKSYSKSCSESGNKVEIISATKTGSATKTATGTASGTASGTATGTGTASVPASGTGKPTGGSSPSGTGVSGPGPSGTGTPTPTDISMGHVNKADSLLMAGIVAIVGAAAAI